MPLITLTYFAARGCQRNGMQGVGKRPEAKQALERLYVMMYERIKELGI